MFVGYRRTYDFIFTGDAIVICFDAIPIVPRPSEHKSVRHQSVGRAFSPCCVGDNNILSRTRHKSRKHGSVCFRNRRGSRVSLGAHVLCLFENEQETG